MTQWGLNFSGRLRVTAINHRLADGTRNEFYYIKERIKVTVHVDIYQGGEWEPLPADFDAWQDHDRYFSVLQLKINCENKILILGRIPPFGPLYSKKTL